MNVKILLRNYSYSFLSHLIMSIPSSYIRTNFLRLYGAKIESNGKIASHVTVMSPWYLVLGQNVVINDYVLLDARGGLVIGNHVDIARETNIWTGQHDYNNDEHLYVTMPVYIEDYVWLTSRTTVLPGCRIGKGAVVASGAVVTRNVESMAVVGGIPAKRISYRKNSLKYILNTR